MADIYSRIISQDTKSFQRACLWHSAWAVNPWRSSAAFFYFYYMGDAVNGTYKSADIFNYWEFFYYSGVIVFLLAIYGTVKMWKRQEFRSVIRSLVIIAIVSYLLSLGENLGLYKLFKLF